MAGNTVLVRQEAAEKAQVLLAPQRDLYEVIGPRNRCGQCQQQQFHQRIQHLRMLARVLEGGEMRQDRWVYGLAHDSLQW